MTSGQIYSGAVHTLAHDDWSGKHWLQATCYPVKAKDVKDGVPLTLPAEAAPAGNKPNTSGLPSLVTVTRVYKITDDQLIRKFAMQGNSVVKLEIVGDGKGLYVTTMGSE